MSLLLQASANVEAKDKFGRTGLHCAAIQDRESMVRILLDAGADIEARDKNDQTPLHHAACFCELAMQYLLAKGPNVDPRDPRGFTPLLEAVARGFETGVKLLLLHDADSHVREDKELEYTVKSMGIDWIKWRLPTRLPITIIWSMGLSPMAGLEFQLKGRMALHFASADGSENLMRLLLEHGASVQTKTSGEVTALHFAVENHHEPAVRLLLEYNVDLKARDCQGRTALHVLSEGNYEESAEEGRISKEMVAEDLKIAKLLLENGADVG